MHDSHQLTTNGYDTHVFVGPGWFKFDLQLLRRIHQDRQTPLSDAQIQNFRTCLDNWKDFYSGTGDKISDPGVCTIQ